MANATSAQIQQVMTECPDCSRHRAAYFLKTCENDVEAAILKCKSLEAEIEVEPDDESGLEDSMADVSAAAADPSTPKDDEKDHVPEPPVAGSGGVFPLDALPKFSAPKNLVKGGEDGSGIFELDKLIGAIQAGADPDKVRGYLAHYSKETLRANLNAEIAGYPAFFYIVETNNTDIIRQWITFGGDPNATHGEDGFPLIAFSILRGGRTMRQATDTLAALLKYGASPSVIPDAFYTPYCRDLPEGGPEDDELHDIEDEDKKWCTQEIRRHLAKSLNLSQRYDLHRAKKVGKHSGRDLEVITRQDALALLGLHQVIIGQSIAVRWLDKKLRAYLTRGLDKPLVLVFAGPSGHGKTELARNFGDLMSLDLHMVDCTTFTHENELFGPRPPYQGHEAGSPLNNFLVQHDGGRSIVFMDEFERTSQAIHNTLLKPFQEGICEDRRNGSIIDCSKTIWILATNKLDDTIHAFCTANEKSLFGSDDSEFQDELVRKLCKKLRREAAATFGAPITGRISEFLPFLVFSPAEQAVIVHKIFMELEEDLARRVKLASNPEDDVYLGNTRLKIRHEASVCSHIAQQEYIEQLGARSVRDGVERIVCEPVALDYLKDGDELHEDQAETHFVVDTNVDGEVDVRLIKHAS